MNSEGYFHYSLSITLDAQHMVYSGRVCYGKSDWYGILDPIKGSEFVVCYQQGASKGPLERVPVAIVLTVH